MTDRITIEVDRDGWPGSAVRRGGGAVTAPMSLARLREIEKTVPAGYSAPWTVDPIDEDGVLRGWAVGYCRDGVAPELRELCGLVATVPDYGERLAEFIAQARTAVPELVAEVKRLTAVVDRLCAHAFPAPTGDPDSEDYGPGDCTTCGMTYEQYDARMGERMAEALEGGA
jgi:hypothetical protein